MIRTATIAGLSLAAGIVIATSAPSAAAVFPGWPPQAATGIHCATPSPALCMKETRTVGGRELVRTRTWLNTATGATLSPWSHWRPAARGSWFWITRL